MALTRVHDPLSITLVRKLGGGGGPRHDQVAAELDNLIAWAKDGPRRIHRDTSTVGNVGGGLDVLHTFSLPANSLATDGDELEFAYGGTFANNDTDKRVNGFFGGTAYEGTGTVDIDGGDWRMTGNIIRLSATSVRVSHTLTYFAIHADSATPPTVTGFSAGFFQVSRLTDITGLANLNSNATTMEVKGEGAANNDVQQKLSTIKLIQQ